MEHTKKNELIRVFMGHWTEANGEPANYTEWERLVKVVLYLEEIIERAGIETLPTNIQYCVLDQGRLFVHPHQRQVYTEVVYLIQNLPEKYKKYPQIEYN